ncbi:HAD-IA family hydrolase [Pelagibacteraceae bacterium]|nr:HAD-IA family hydrolase [Pelagibacteraceae bacterium]
MKYKALLFGSIGTLIESSDIQRNSFNEAFKEAGLDWYWDEQDYKILLKKSGGTKRVEDFAEKNNVNVNASKIRNRKTEIFSSFIMNNKPKLRKSVNEIINFTKKNNIKLALSTSTTINNVEAVFKSLSNQISKEDFHFIGNRSLVKNEKPNSEIYKLTLEKLNLEPDNCLAIEDTEESSKSAVNAGIKCIGFPGDYHSDDSFEMCIKKVKILDQSLFSL